MNEGKQTIELPNTNCLINNFHNNNIVTINPTSKISLNKTIKIKNKQKIINEGLLRNFSFNGGKESKKLINENNNIRMNSPIKNNINKKIEINKNNISYIIGKNKLYDEKKDDSDNEQLKTPKKTKDNVKIIPYKLLDKI